MPRASTPGCQTCQPDMDRLTGLRKPLVAEAKAEEEERAQAVAIEDARAGAVADAESCAVCGLSSGTEGGTPPLWIACDSCHQWYHGSCAGVTVEMLDLVEDEDHWECHACWLARSVPPVARSIGSFPHERAPSLPPCLCTIATAL